MGTDRQVPRQNILAPDVGATRHPGLLSLAAGALLLSQAPPAALAQTATEPAGVEQITVTGTRRQDRSPTDLPSPVDIIGADQLTDQGDTDTINLIRAVVPSFNSDANPLSGTPTYMRPVSLRGLSPDHVLVLMDGKRRHRGANVATFSGGNTDGSQGPDISAIPAIALQRVEVLRDGAAAQYGSDAIAGVINFILDDSAEGGIFRAKYATTYEGDGDRYQLAGSFGLPLGDSGFVRFSGEYSEQEESTRAVQRPDAAALANGGNPVIDPSAIRQPVVTKYGIPEIDDELKLAINMGAPIGSTDSEFYGFGTFATRKVEGDFFYRNPIDRFGVFTDAAGNFLIGDMTPEDGVNCEGGIDFGGTGMVNDPIGIDDPDAAARMDLVFNDPDCFSFIEVFPGGYTPRFGAEVSDLFGATGIQGTFENGMTYDISTSVGRSEIKFFASNVPNPSMGSQSPTVFPRVGDRIVLENFFNVDLAYPVDIAAFASPLHIAAGFEWHNERFDIVAGEPASFQTGVLGEQGFLIGEEAIPGFSPAIAGAFSRHNVAAYLDFETDVTDALVLGAAVRHEDFSDETGNETTFKLSGMLRLTDALAVRSTYATGFHAPSIGQTQFSTTTTEFDEDGNLVESGQIPPTSPTALAVGGSALKPETSESVTFGVVLDSDWLSLTIDAYYIEVDDRITLSASQELTDEQRQALIDEGFQAAAGFGSFRFFINDFATETQGVDVVATMPLTFLDRGDTVLRAAFNWNETEVTSFDPSDPNELLDEVRVTQIEDNYPNLRGNVSLVHVEDRWSGHMRVNYYGDFTEMHVNGNLPIFADAVTTVDAEVTYNVTDNIDVSVGAENLFGEEPTRNPWDFIVGSKYPTTQPNGLDNGLWYLRAGYIF